MVINFKILFLTFFLCAEASAFYVKKYEKAPKKMSTVSYVLARYSKKNLIKNLRDFVKCCRPNRMVGTSGHKKAVPFLVDRLKEIDSTGDNLIWVEEFEPDVDYAIALYQKDFKDQIEGKYDPNSETYKLWNRFTENMVRTFNGLRKIKGRNVIWEKKGSEFPNQVLVVGAHYDTIANNKKTLEILPNENSPGADDNGSGVAIALSLIQVLLELDLKRTVRVVFFDYEELGFLGSRAYVQKNKKIWKEGKEKLAGYINLEMLGHDTKKEDKKKKHYNMKMYIRKPSDKGHQDDLKLANYLQQMGSKVQGSAKFTILANGFNRSDNINFWNEGFPAVTFSQNWEDDFNQARYHTHNDFVETLNLKTYFQVFRYIAGSVVGWSFDLQK